MLTEYVRAIQNIPILSRDEEISLGIVIQSYPDNSTKIEYENAINTLVTSNLRFVVFMAMKRFYENEIMDAIQEGNLGLIKAAQEFNPDFGVKFITYAKYQILLKFRDFKRRRNLVHLKSYYTESNVKCLIENNVSDNRIDIEKGYMAKEYFQIFQGTRKDRKKYIVTSVLGLEQDPKTFEETGKDLGISKQRAYQLYNEIMVRLRRIK
jgi:RNA polymerase sigma factor (sigma-70 family)